MLVLVFVFLFLYLKIDGIRLDCPGLLRGQSHPGAVDHARKGCCHQMNVSWRMNFSPSIAHALQPKTTGIHLYSTGFGLLAHCSEGDTTLKRTMGHKHLMKRFYDELVLRFELIGNVKEGSRKHGFVLNWVLSESRSNSIIG